MINKIEYNALENSKGNERFYGHVYIRPPTDEKVQSEGGTRLARLGSPRGV